MKLQGDTVAVIHKDGYKSDVLVIPEAARAETRATPVRALVIEIGNKFRFKDDVGIGHTIIVPQHLGTRLPSKYNTQSKTLIIYDGEDVLAIEEHSS